MGPVDAAVVLRDKMKYDPDLARALQAMVARSDHDDLYAWCEANPEMATKIAEQAVDVDGQIANMQSRIDQGDLS